MNCAAGKVGHGPESRNLKAIIVSHKSRYKLALLGGQGINIAGAMAPYWFHWEGPLCS